MEDSDSQGANGAKRPEKVASQRLDTCLLGESLPCQGQEHGRKGERNLGQVNLVVAMPRHTMSLENVLGYCLPHRDLPLKHRSMDPSEK